MQNVPMPPTIANDGEWHALHTIRLGELIEDGWLDWSSELFDWSEYAADADMFTRICEGFNERFYYDEIADYTLDQWRRTLMHTIKDELCPKYNSLWRSEMDITVKGSSRSKSRVMHSEFPETLLSGNSDYVSDGVDSESEDVEHVGTLEALEAARNGCGSVVQAFLDGLEFLFMHVYTNDVYPI